MENSNITPKERDWCKMTMLRITNHLPMHYSILAKARLKKKGIEVGTRYIIDCRNLNRYDTRVVKALEELAEGQSGTTESINF